MKLDSLVSQMSLKDRLLFQAMNNADKEKIKKKAEKKMNFRICGTQTECDLTQSSTETEEVFLEPLVGHYFVNILSLQQSWQKFSTVKSIKH